MKDKEQTKRKLIDAVGVIIKTKGYAALRVSKVAKEAAVDRKLVYRYFGNMDNLTEAYISENDYWVLFAEQLKSLSNNLDDTNSKIVIISILQELFKFVLQEKEMQDLLMMELSGTNPMMKSIHNFRESIGQSFLNATDVHFKGSNVNFRAVAALLVGGIYYTVLHTRKNGFHFANLDLKSEEGTRAIVETVSQVINWAFVAANK